MTLLKMKGSVRISNIGIPCISKVTLCLFSVSKELHWYLFSLAREIEENFHFTKRKGGKQK